MTRIEDQPRPGLTLPAICALVAVFVLLAVFGFRQIGSHDLGFHLRAGDAIIDGNGWPRTDTFTFTVQDHAYVDTSWGFQVLVSTVERFFGAPGLVVWQVATALALFFLVYRTTRLVSVDALSLAALFLIAVVAVEIRVDVRPEWLSYLLLAATLHVLVRHEQGLPSPLWLLPVFQLLWVNVHSLFVLGWVAMACFVVGTGIRERRLDRTLLKWSALALPVTLLNPYGTKALLFPLTLISRLNKDNVFGSAIGELFSVFTVDSLPFYPWLSINALRLLLLLAGVSALILVRAHGTRRTSQVLLVLAFAPLAFQAVRNGPLLLVACLPAMVAALPLTPFLQKLAPGSWRTALRNSLFGSIIVIALLLGARVAGDGYYIADRRQVRFGVGWNPLLLPVDAAEWVAAADLPGQMLNDLGFGGYLMWRLDREVFIDGRLEVMGEDFFREYNAALASPAALSTAAARHSIDWIILRHRRHDRLVHALTRDARWRLLYIDGQAAIYAREGSAASNRTTDVSARRVVSGPHGGEPFSTLPALGGEPRRSGMAAWLGGLVAGQAFPARDYGLGQFHYFRADMDAAYAHFTQAIHDSGGAYPELYNNLGASALFRGRRDEARRAFEVVLKATPGDPYATKKLAELTRHSGPPAP